MQKKKKKKIVAAFEQSSPSRVPRRGRHRVSRDDPGEAVYVADECLRQGQRRRPDHRQGDEVPLVVRSHRGFSQLRHTMESE